ncbi:BACON domain-containing protein [Sodaliphilus sp.]|uniref:BACON domain-containing protein n=1 Tax=Sodaliphilus sp. TaxID=2815818 RepID=UPI00388D58AF
MNKILKLFLFLSVLAVTVTVQAQTAGDKLFSQGQKLQMIIKPDSQKKAIKKFEAAKKAYDSREKKAMCDQQIIICKNILRGITPTPPPTPDTVVVKKEEDVKPQKKEPVTLSLSVSSVEFKSSGKKGDNHEVTVNCNYDTWTYSYPDWISVTKNGNILTLTASANKTGEERSAVLVVECDGTKAELLLYQKNKFNLKSLIKKKK